MYKKSYSKDLFFDPNNNNPVYNEFFADLWGQIENPEDYTENIIVRNGRKKSSWTLTDMMNTFQRSHFFKKFWKTDLFFTPNTFRPCGSFDGDAHERNLFRICSWALDVDYDKNPHYIRDSYTPLQIFGLLEDLISRNILPAPNWIEYGHCFRMIYILKDPIGYQTGKKMIRYLKKIQDYFCKIINTELDLHCERQKLASYYRVPGSVNSKDGSTISIQKISSKKLSLDDLSEYMPEKNHFERTPVKSVIDGYVAETDNEGVVAWKQAPEDDKENSETEKNRKKKARKNPCKKHNQYTLCTERMTAFRALRTWPNIPRELLVFLYGTTWLTINNDKRNLLLNELLEFNRGFPNPLSEKEIRTKFRCLKIYDHYSNDSIRTTLGLTTDDVESDPLTECLSLTKREREKRDKTRTGNTRQQLAEKNHQKIRELYLQGINRNEIVEILGLSISTVKKKITEIRKEEMDSERT